MAETVIEMTTAAIGLLIALILTLQTSLSVAATSHQSNWAQNEPARFYITKYEATAANAAHHTFLGNRTDYFKVLHQGVDYVLIGAKNALYNLSLADDLREVKGSRIEWSSSDAHRELCVLKGKRDEDCQNYIRVYGRTKESEEGGGGDQFMLCGTNSYKPVCRFYNLGDSAVTTTISESGGAGGQKTAPLRDHVNEVEAQGRCPYNPRHSSSYVFADGQLYSATVADFSSSDPLIYREPQRTEQYDLKQLNQPDFISTYEYKEHVYFFFRETAMEFENCGKAIYSRVGRVCKSDKGGPYPFNNRWTTFVKTRLNCSVAGDYPFYFDELQATSRIIESVQPNGDKRAMIYGVFQTPHNSIPGSAVCAFDFDDIEAAFEGRFKAQKDSTSNWLPIPLAHTPEPHPARCVADSRTMASNTVNFIRKHPLMEDSARPAHNQPLFTTVGSKHRLTAITVDAQVKTIAGDETVDIVYVGTDDGRVIKFFSYSSSTDKNDTPTIKTVIVSDVQVLPAQTRINELSIAAAASVNRLVVAGNGIVVTSALDYCRNLTSTCDECVRVPECTWHVETHECVSWRSVVTRSAAAVVSNIKSYVQDIRTSGDGAKQCKKVAGDQQQPAVVTLPLSSRGTVAGVGHLPPHVAAGFPLLDTNEITMTSISDRDLPDILLTSGNSNDDNNDPAADQSALCRRDHPNFYEANPYSAQLMVNSVVVASVLALVVGVIAGCYLSRRFCTNHFMGGAEQRNHLGWHTKMHPRNSSKDVNLLMNTNQLCGGGGGGPPTAHLITMNIPNNNNNIHHQQQHMNNHQVVTVPIPVPHGSPKKDNLDHDNNFDNGAKDRKTQEYKNSTESLDKDIMHSKTGTLQKVKKTYI